MEYIARRLFQSNNASCIPPLAYGQRFQDFILIDVLKPIMKSSESHENKLEELVRLREIKELEKKKASEKKARGYEALRKILKKVGLGRSTVHKLTMNLNSRSKNSSNLDENEMVVVKKRTSLGESNKKSIFNNRTTATVTTQNGKKLNISRPSKFKK